MRAQMTPWELRGYLAYPNHFGKPRPGSREEIPFCRGWERAQREDMINRENGLNDEHLYGRDTYFANYDRK